MNKQQEIDKAVEVVTAQIRELEDFIDNLLRENKPENAGLIAAMLEDIKRRHTFQ